GRRDPARATRGFPCPVEPSNLYDDPTIRGCPHASRRASFATLHLQRHSMNTAGLVGLGAMGAGIATTLRNRGYALHVCDARPGVAAQFAARGGTACDTPAEVAAACEVLV